MILVPIILFVTATYL